MKPTQWAAQQLEKNKNVYLIVDPTHQQKPLASYAAHDGTSAQAVLREDDIKNALLIGPWLLNITHHELAWFEQALETGIAIATHLPLKTTRAHFASLFEVNINDSSFYFPFYRPSYIGPMLPRMNEAEHQALLNKHTLGLLHEGQWLTYAATGQGDAYPIQAPGWWTIQPAHFSPEENLPLIQANLETWLWQHFPDVMERNVEESTSTEKVMPASRDKTTKTLTYRVMLAAIITLIGAPKARMAMAQQLLKDNQNEEVQHSLYVLVQQKINEA